MNFAEYVLSCFLKWKIDLKNKCCQHLSASAFVFKAANTIVFCFSLNLNFTVFCFILDVDKRLKTIKTDFFFFNF